MRTHSDPTAGAAIGAMDRELRQMKKKAMLYRTLRQNGHWTPAMEQRVRREFSGFYRPLRKIALGY